MLWTVMTNLSGLYLNHPEDESKLKTVLHGSQLEQEQLKAAIMPVNAGGNEIYIMI